VTFSLILFIVWFLKYNQIKAIKIYALAKNWTIVLINTRAYLFRKKRKNKFIKIRIREKTEKMTLVYSTEGYFCEGEVVKDWRFKMEFGRIILSDLKLSLVKKSDINLTEMGSSVDSYKEGFIIPLTQIKKAYSANIQKVYVVVIETRDGLLFSITMANEKSIGRQDSIDLSEKINTTILLALKESIGAQSLTDYKIKPQTNSCINCGEEISYSWKFCKNCGREL
jgi:hypothetical protein